MLNAEQWFGMLLRASSLKGLNLVDSHNWLSTIVLDYTILDNPFHSYIRFLE
jgi:hypothetical protein